MARWGRLLTAKAWRDEFKSQFSLEKPGLAVLCAHLIPPLWLGKLAGAAGCQSRSRFSEKPCLKAIL